MHDYFEIVGVPSDARGDRVRRAVQRHTRAAHPDIDDGSGMADAGPALRRPVLDAAGERDLAIDFLDVSEQVDRMIAAFFGPRC